MHASFSATQSDQRAVLLVTAVLLLITGFGGLAALLWSEAAGPGFTTTSLLILALGALGTLVLARTVLLRRTRQHVFSPLNLVALNVLVLFVVSGLRVVSKGETRYFSLGDESSLRAMNLALILALLWTLAFIVVYSSRIPRMLAAGLRPLRPLDRARVERLVPLLFGMSVVAWAARLLLFGGVDAYLFHANRIRGAIGQAPLFLMEQLGLYAFFLALVSARAFRARKFYVYGIVTGLPVFVRFALAGGSKSGVLQFAFGVAVVLFLGRARRLRPVLVTGVLTILLASFVFIDSWNRSNDFLPSSDSTLSNASAKLDLVNRRLRAEMAQEGPIALLYPLLGREALETVTLIVRDTKEYRPIETVGHAAISFVPRFVWPSKPIVSEGVLFGRRYLNDATTTSYATTQVGSGYMAGGVAGVLLVAIVEAFACGLLYGYAMNNGIAGVFFYAVVVMRILYFAETGIVDFVSGVLPQVVIALLILRFASRPRAELSSRFAVHAKLRAARAQ